MCAARLPTSTCASPTIRACRSTDPVPASHQPCVPLATVCAPFPPPPHLLVRMPTLCDRVGSVAKATTRRASGRSVTSANGSRWTTRPHSTVTSSTTVVSTPLVPAPDWLKRAHGTPGACSGALRSHWGSKARKRTSSFGNHKFGSRRRKCPLCAFSVLFVTLSYCVVV